MSEQAPLPQPESEFKSPAELLKIARKDAAAMPPPSGTEISNLIKSYGSSDKFGNENDTIRTVPKETDLENIAKINRPELRTKEILENDPNSLQNIAKRSKQTTSVETPPVELPTQIGPAEQPESDQSKAA